MKFSGCESAINAKETAKREIFLNFCGVRLKIISAAGRKRYRNVRLFIFIRGASFQFS